MRRERRADALLCIALFGFFFAMNVDFNGYHGGFSAGPRYLIPGIPFLALPLTAAFTQLRALTCLLAIPSVAINLLLTATDAQNPTGVGGHTRVDDGRPDDSSYNLVTDYAWPLFIEDRAWPLLQQEIKIELPKAMAKAAEESSDPQQQAELKEAARKAFMNGIRRGDAYPLLLASIEGPVSVNPLGVYEGLLTYGLFPPAFTPVPMGVLQRGRVPLAAVAAEPTPAFDSPRSVRNQSNPMRPAGGTGRGRNSAPSGRTRSRSAFCRFRGCPMTPQSAPGPDLICHSANRPVTEKA